MRLLSLFPLWFFPPVLSAGPLTLPAELAGEPNRYVVVTPECDPSCVVEWVVPPGLDADLPFTPSDPRILVFIAPTPGTYRVGAYTATMAGDKPVPTPVVWCEVTIGSGPAPPPVPPPVPPPTPPSPVPPSPPPTPVDPLAAELCALVAADLSPMKAGHLESLVSLYTELAKLPSRRKPDGSYLIPTAGELYATLVKASDIVLPSDALVSVRKRIAVELATNLPTDPSTALTDAQRVAAAALFTRVRDCLRKAGE